MGERLGSGGMGEVFLARRGSQTVVIKRILPRLAADKAFLDRFLHEARVVARLNDPTIVRIVELGDVDGQWFLAMEFVDGVDLQALLAKGALPRGAALRIALEAATALSVAHGAKDAAGRLTPVVHRDVSPHNLLVSSAGAVKLIDFGVASLTGQGETGGKLAYAAPEQLLEDVTDAKSDQYSLGVVLWECLAHRQAFDADDDVEVIRLVTEVGLPPLPEEPFREVVAKMTAMDPADRFESVVAARAALLAEVRERKLDVSAASLAGLVPARGQLAVSPNTALETKNAVALDATEQRVLDVLRDGMTLDEAELAIDAASLPGSPFALDLLQALVEKGALRSSDGHFVKTG
ncbi:MAG: serine/threonine-protein kinase [Archangium sp.]|nr:serine/threonine-protein kinase [Archangium sp.]MDP3151619.1 serine/threonine-protein kinase [Archangium sp.]MDP3569154.1 serine/threonine-protein kinase [Archangium sp.]